MPPNAYENDYQNRMHATDAIRFKIMFVHGIFGILFDERFFEAIFEKRRLDKCVFRGGNHTTLSTI